MQTVAEIARDTSYAQDLDTLLNRAVQLIHERFGFYHAGIFLLDAQGDYAVLRAANSAGGKQMLAQKHKLKVGEVGIVGDTTSTGRPHIALDVGVDDAHFAHPLLPETRSEMALPLTIAGRIIGALDVQSVETNAFEDDDITILQLMADLLAIAIHNSQLLTEVQQTVLDIQMAYSIYTQTAWEDWAQGKQIAKGYRFRGSGIELVEDMSSVASQAIKSGRNVLTKAHPSTDGNGESLNHLAVPITLRGETLGVINLQVKGDEVPTDIINLVESVTNRLALNLDNARLLETSLQQAQRERLSGHITKRIRESLDPEMILQTMIREIGDRLNIPEVEIRMGTGIPKPPLDEASASNESTSSGSDDK
jgi:GAF domain-containing protein